MHKKLCPSQLLRNIVFTALFIVLFANNLQANDEFFRAMQDEMTRSMNQLQLKNQQKPYFIEYTLEIKRHNSVEANLGQILRFKKDSVWAELNVTLRVGSYKFDQKNFFDIGLNYFGSDDDEEYFTNRRIPVELDYSTIRRELWLATDVAYKEAAEIYSKKEAALKSQTRKDTLWDFAKSPKIELYDTIPLPSFDLKSSEDIVVEASKVFLDYSAIQNSQASIYYEPSVVYYLNSEGTKYVKNNLLAGIEVGAYTQATDGMPLADFYIALGWVPSDLPSKDSIVKATKAMAEVLTKLVDAPSLEDNYTGPILFLEQPACETFAQVYVPCLTAQRDPFSSSIVRVTFGGNSTKAFQTKIGGRVLPEFLSMQAIPTAINFNNNKLLGSYKIDNEGVLAKDISLIENGYLKTLLNDRTPFKRINESNGHSRGGLPLASNIKIESDKKYQANEKELKAELLKFCKQRDLPFGLVVKKIQNSHILATMLFQLSGYNLEYPQAGTLYPTEVYKLYPDGREELIRGGSLVGMTPTAFRDITKVGSSNFVLNYLQPAGWNKTNPRSFPAQLVSIIGQSLLFEDAEYRVSESNLPKTPVLSNPVGQAQNGN